MLEDFRAFYRLKFPYGKIRPQQIVMMEKIFHSIKNRRNLIVEAPTGVGKTLSYLLPAIYFAERGKRIMILTETIDQQERILEELERLRPNLQISFIMGKNNFICKAKDSKADGLFCKLNRRCSHKPNRRTRCICGTEKKPVKIGDEIKYFCPFCICDYQKSKIECLEGDIVVMNNSIFYHIKEEIDVNRKTEVIICDEAHKLEKSIRNSATVEINPEMALRRLRAMAYYFAPSTLKKYLKRVRERYSPLDVDKLEKYDRDFWSIVERYVSGHLDIEGCKDILLYYGEEILETSKGRVVILGTLLDGYYQIRDIKDKILSFEENRELEREELRFTVDNRALVYLEYHYVYEKRLPDMPLTDFLDRIGSLEVIDDNFVIYRSGKSLLCVPVLVSSYLKRLYDDATVIHCSATIGNLKIHGLKTGVESFDTLVLDSPFPKERRRIIALTDGVNMKYQGTDRDLKRRRANENIFRLLRSANANTLVLFRSFEDLESTYNYLLARSPELKKKIFCYQPDMNGRDAKILKERFEREGGILLATGRFAEGVDIPGEALTMVIIDSLPFPVPTPLLNREQKLIKERLLKKGLDPKSAHWMSFLMTSFHIMASSVIQMIGRLIRTERDYGVVVIQDKRFYQWVGEEMKKRGYLKDQYISMSLSSALEYIPRFLKRFKSN
ncbi:MAG TPA: ATP-dependent DNA helicase [Methanothermococcus okinawensis]|uniref:ATP-dependent DNA helicase n=1 Tax=Methanothermococcus okinawensis TaxID=155863 RepID=A0A832ZRH0_9EURY|nr:ATP-dependent DNA helicase [Methanothermococcus okinawensis]